VREQLEVLEDHADRRAQLREVGLRGSPTEVPLTMISPLWKGSRPLTHLISVDLPEPEGPQTTITSPLWTCVVQSVSTWN
jgi:hypothetical protein